jgi:hypothetical protein|eukprot:COSAG06_NODE_5445_length_3480_cov_5.599527_3_plen_45_part_00
MSMPARVDTRQVRRGALSHRQGRRRPLRPPIRSPQALCKESLWA